ncbi:hypothetical protein BPOR_0370g00080 [Botrytis porri]|uniref:Transcription factor domain-containing protein n=1 Tax=Botrytis porri TaxID=87229 RepID=A0A4Z1KJI2_9HELO|nr:hypothetical protein BPOR_0370g00080 [Botrytis porri]
MPLMPVSYSANLSNIIRLCVRKEDAGHVELVRSSVTKQSPHAHNVVVYFIIARTTGVYLDSSLVWNPSASVAPPQNNKPKEPDTLPPYAELPSDEQREKKASYYPPGTFTLALMPHSFHDLAEYHTKSSRPNGFRKNRYPSAQRFQSTRPDVVILDRFEGFSGSRCQSENPLSRKASMENVLSPGGLPTTLVNRDTDSHLLDHYRNVLANQICWLAEQVSGPDIFERYSADYSPLYLAILALSSLSLSQLNHIPFEDVLERYHMVITALGNSVKTEEDARSDGALFTHYLLLLFEVAATGHRTLNMWEQHSSRIQSILQLRQKAYGKEPHGFIIVYTLYVDMYALLTTTGTGSFSKTIIEQNMLPPPEDALENQSINMIIMPEAFRQMPDLLRMNRELTLIALEMAQTGRALKVEQQDLSKPRLEVNMDECRSMHELHILLMEFRETWSRFLEAKTPEESWLRELAQLPSGPFTCRTHVSSLNSMQKEPH